MPTRPRNRSVKKPPKSGVLPAVRPPIAPVRLVTPEMAVASDEPIKR